MWFFIGVIVGFLIDRGVEILMAYVEGKYISENQFKETGIVEPEKGADAVGIEEKNDEVIPHKAGFVAHTFKGKTFYFDPNPSYTHENIANALKIAYQKNIRGLRSLLEANHEIGFYQNTKLTKNKNEVIG